MLKAANYSLGLSSFSLLVGETITAAAVFQETARNPGETRERLQSSNLLQRKHFSSSTVAVREVVKRLRHADEWELDTLVENLDYTDSSFICLLLVSRQYPILLELVRTLIKYKFDGRDTSLQSYEIESWFYGFLEENPPKREIRESSIKRLIINARQILREGGLISPASPLSPASSSSASTGPFVIHRPGVSLAVRIYYENLRKQENLEMLLFSNRQIKEIMVAGRGNASSARGNTAPARGNASSAKGNTAPGRGNTSSARGSTSPAKGNTAPARSNASSAMGNTSPAKESPTLRSTLI